MTGIAGAEEIRGSMLDCMASPTSKAFNVESRQHRLMSLALHITTQFDNIVVLFNSKHIFRLSKTISETALRLPTVDIAVCSLDWLWSAVSVRESTSRDETSSWRCTRLCRRQSLNPKIDFLTVCGMVTSVGCNARSSPAVYVVTQVFNSSVHSRITLKIITFCRT